MQKTKAFVREIAFDNGKRLKQYFYHTVVTGGNKGIVYKVVHGLLKSKTFEKVYDIQSVIGQYDIV